MSVKITTSQKRPVLVMGCGLGGYLVYSDMGWMKAYSMLWMSERELRGA
jgi:hypothetical protein